MKCKYVIIIQQITLRISTGENALQIGIIHKIGTL